MKILLEAFVDNNFGDNLFLHIITSRNPEHTFYMLEKEAYADSYRIIENEIANLVVCKDEAFLKEMEAMCVVGGDLFWDRGDYSELIRHAHTIKEQGGSVSFLGFSLFPKYSWRTWFDLAVLFSHGDQIVLREDRSYQQLKKHIPWISAASATDLAFTTDVTELKKEEVQKGLLGVSVRKKIQRDSETHYPKYCKAVAEMIEDYLAQSEEHKVCFLALSSGVYDDRKVAEDIRKLCGKTYQMRISCSAFDGNVENYLKEIQKCEKLICTRFHALVFAILLGKAFLPIIYEEKMNRLLEAVAYKGMRLQYENAEAASMACGVCAGKALELYLQKAEMFSEKLKLKRAGSKGMSDVFYGLYQLKEFLLCKIYRKYIGKKW